MDKKKPYHFIPFIYSFLILLFFCSIVLPMAAETVIGRDNPGRATDPSLRRQWYRQHIKMNDSSIFKNFPWTFIGPLWMSGRITDIEVAVDNPFTIYAAAASGGVWKSINEGTTWSPIFEHGLSTSIGDIAVSPSNPKIIWIGTGEKNSSRSSYSGAGVYKSSDGGQTWESMGLEDSHHISRIIIHPQKPDIVYVAAIGHLYSYNVERGVFRTLNGGKTWKNLLPINERTGIIDLVIDPTDRRTLYASAWNRLRRAWNMWEFGRGSGIFKSIDGGETWHKISGGLLSKSKTGRIGLALAPSNPNILYAIVDNHETLRKAKRNEVNAYGLKTEKIIKGAVLYRSSDKGKHWQIVSQDNLQELYGEYGYYFGEIRVHPKNENTVFLLGIPLLKSTDGGRTFNELSYNNLHLDHHALWIDPANPNRMISGNDGGVNLSYDGGSTWKHIGNLPIVQFYNVSVDMEKPFNIYGSAQDHGCFKGPVTHDPDRDIPYEWLQIPGGEASYIATDPEDVNILYSEYYYGSLIRTDLRAGEIKSIKPQIGKNEPALRCNWLTPFIISPHHPQTLYYGCQYLFYSNDRGDHWQRISPDLTTNPRKIDGNVPFATITTISESPLVKGLIYVGTDDGNVVFSPDNGATWEKINRGIPYKKWVSRLVASNHNKNTVYVTLNGYRDDDFTAYVYSSNDNGRTWTDIGSRLPGGPVNVIREDPKQKDILYIGTDLGVYISLDQGKNWYSLTNNLPTTFVHDLIIHPRDNILVAATHGRGFYTLHLSPIREYVSQPHLKNKHLYIFEPITSSVSTSWNKPPKRSAIDFLLKTSQRVNITIKDDQENIVNSFSMQGESGFNHISWDTLVAQGKNKYRSTAPGSYTLVIQAGEIKEEKRIK